MKKPAESGIAFSIAEGVLGQESRALRELLGRLDAECLESAASALLDCTGLVLVAGAGTSSSVARRLAHILTCSGLRSIYLDPALTQHGFSGIIGTQDVLIAISRGGETGEVNHLLEIARARGTPRIGITENMESSMARLCDVVLEAAVDPELDAGGVIPLASTMVHAAIGDILCVMVQGERGYSEEEFASLHPGGAVGRRLNASSSSRPDTAEADDCEDLTEPSTADADLGQIRGFVLDMDGVLWRGDQPLPGLSEFFQWMKESDLDYVLATNNPSKTPDGFAQKARELGVEVEPSRIITSVVATVHYLQGAYPPGSKVFAMGEPALKKLLVEGGFELAEERVEAVVIALDRSLNYEMMKRATLLIRAGAEFIGTNADPSYPTEEGIVPGSGSIVTAIAASSDRQPRIAGKPGALIFDLALKKLGLPPDKVASVGDRLETDIAGGLGAGLKTVLVLTGVADQASVEASPIKPDWIFNDLPALTAAVNRSRLA